MSELQQATMEEREQIAKRAAREITAWMRAQKRTLDVINVEGDPAYQKRDIDLLWITRSGTYEIEVKGDNRAHATGNFFFETESNAERGTRGCFMYTEAAWVFYYLVATQELYMLPMPATREWFQQNLESFGPDKKTQTRIGDRRAYTTVGKIVKIPQVLRAVPGVLRASLAPRPPQAAVAQASQARRQK